MKPLLTQLLFLISAANSKSLTLKRGNSFLRKLKFSKLINNQFFQVEEANVTLNFVENISIITSRSPQMFNLSKDSKGSAVLIDVKSSRGFLNNLVYRQSIFVQKVFM